MRYFLDKGRALIPYQVSDPVSFGANVQGLASGTVQDAIARFETAYGRAVKAEGYATNGYVHLAVEEWRKVVGDYFPSYG